VTPYFTVFGIGFSEAPGAWWLLFNFENYTFSGKVIWTSLLEFTIAS